MRTRFPLRRVEPRHMPGGNALKAYRVYSFDGVNRIIAAENIEAETDAQALRAAKEVASGISFEVWDQHRLVARYKP